MTVGRIKHPQETARKEDILEAVSVAHTHVLLQGTSKHNMCQT